MLLLGNTKLSHVLGGVCSCCRWFDQQLMSLYVVPEHTGDVPRGEPEEATNGRNF